MKTLNELKRDLQGGNIILVMTKNSCSDRLIGKKRKVVESQSNGISFIDPDDPTSKKSFLAFPKASLLEYDGEYIRIFNAGKRELTEDEKAIKAGYEKIRDKKQEERDLLADSNCSFFCEQAYYLKYDAEYLIGHTTQRGMRFDYRSGLVRDDKVKGELSLEYKVIKAIDA
jgi:hypothetical protein